MRLATGMKIPTGLEMLQLLRLFERVLHISRRTVREELRLSTPFMSGLEARKRVLPPGKVREMRDHLLRLMDEHLDPYYPPFPGIDKEWYEYIQGARRLLMKELDEVVPPIEGLITPTHPVKRKRKVRYV